MQYTLICLTVLQVLEFCVAKEEYTAWCREHLKKPHPQWMRRHSKISRIGFNPRAPHQILLHDDQMLCVLDKSQVKKIGRTRIELLVLKIRSS